ncbi:uncharacterized protein BDW70DRAFT_12352 [Aspergillus foveolatus]|uniref:uncharacterized protein n=1 Tax=Aspergillus foveolatus TaxID=210207 RepID=UPI003CCD7DA7
MKGGSESLFFICQFCSARGHIQRYPVALSLKKSRRKRSAGAESASVRDVTRASLSPLMSAGRRMPVNSTATGVSQRICKVTGWQRLRSPCIKRPQPHPAILTITLTDRSDRVQLP